MNRLINQITIGFVGLFVLGVVVIGVYQAVWVTPARACEAKGAWWDPQTRICATPIFLPDITHRPIRPRTPAPQAPPVS